MCILCCDVWNARGICLDSTYLCIAKAPMSTYFMDSGDHHKQMWIFLRCGLDMFPWLASNVAQAKI